MSIKAKLLTPDSFAQVPLKLVGPVMINADQFQQEVKIPLATYEAPLWPSVERGMRVANHGGGVNVKVLSKSMTRSIAVQADSLESAVDVLKKVSSNLPKYQEIVNNSSRFAKLLDIDGEVLGRVIYLRIKIDPADASGHNMATKAGQEILNSVIEEYPVEYVSVSANLCTDKKVSAVNALQGRGQHCVAEVQIPRKICQKLLRTTPEEIEDLNYHKNCMGSILAGSVRSANAHFANILLAFYIATGQDPANVVEGSQGVTYAKATNDSLYFSVSIPNVIVGSVGNGKDLKSTEGVMQNVFKQIDPVNQEEVGFQSACLAQLATVATLCGELSLMAALTNQGELIKSHVKLER